MTISSPGRSTGAQGAGTRPNAPAWGIEVNEAEIARHPFEQEITHATGAILEDGTIVDW